MNKTIKLFCLPYAGGSAVIYNEWLKSFNTNIKVIPIELAGRGYRYSEPLYDSFNSAVTDVYNKIVNDISFSEYAIFGHSMGSLLALEVFSRIRLSNLKKPLHLFFSGAMPPHTPKDKIIHKLDDEEFADEIFKKGGTPDEVINSKEILDLCLPILRSDIKNLELYQHKIKSKINCNISVLYGNEDEMLWSENKKEKYNIDEWENYTTGTYRSIKFDGGHFFINENMNKIIKIVNETLLIKYRTMVKSIAIKETIANAY